jgi:hypothetical protein
MVGVSKEWRAAVKNESWCRVTCMRFPRVVAIVTALELETPVYREVYREQLACTVPAATSPRCRSPSVLARDNDLPPPVSCVTKNL